MKNNISQKISNFLEQVYILLLNDKQREIYAWKKLKRIHIQKNWCSGFYENDKRIKSSFNYSDSEVIDYWYAVEEDQLACRVLMIQEFPEEFTSDVFILSAHFNNILWRGKIEVNIKHRYVEYNLKSELLTVLMYPGRMEWMTSDHYHASLDIIWAFRKLIAEQEPPAFIIAELMQKRQAENERDNNDQSSD